MSGDGVGWSTIALILLVIVGSIMVVFLGYLVRTAYEMKIGLKSQLDRGLHVADEEGNKRARVLRQELGADVERARVALFEEARRRFTETLASLEKRQIEFQGTVRQERVETSVTLDVLRDEIAMLSMRLVELERTVHPDDPRPATAGVSHVASVSTPPAPIS